MMAVAATETPTLMPDFDRMEMVNEVLLMSGVRMPENRTVPLLNSHMAHDSSNLLGSATDLKVKNRELIARNVFSSEAESEFTKVKEGHLRDVSVGYEILKVKYVEDGETEKIAGREFTGPINVVTSWRIRELSVTPIGADELAKMRGAKSLGLPSVPHTEREFQVNKYILRLLQARGLASDVTEYAAVRAWLLENGMPADIEDSEDAVHEFIAENLDAIGTARNAPAAPPAPPADPPAPTPPEPPQQRSEPPAAPQIDVDSIAARAAEAATRALVAQNAEREAARLAMRTEVDTLCEQFGLSESRRTEVYACGDLSSARAKILEILASGTESIGSSIGFGPSQREKHSGAIRTAFNLQTLNAATNDTALIDRVYPVADRSPLATDLSQLSVFELARQSLVCDGYRIDNLNRTSIAQAALGFGEQIGVRSSVGYHSTASFPQLMLDAINMNLRAGYTERQMTWRIVFRQAASVSDFKNKHLIMLSEAPSLPVWDGVNPPEEVAFADSKETYAVEARSQIASFDWKSLVNDSMDALSRIPFLLGVASNRTINEVAWAQITANAALQDGVALFSAASGARKKSNLITGSATPTVTTLGAMRKLMRLQVGHNDPAANASEAILNLSPRFLVYPAALETGAEQLLNSIGDPADNKSSATSNPFGSSLTGVVEPLLDANSATAWYMFADTNQVDTVEVSFLQGQESPVTNSWSENATMAQKYMVLQSFNAKAVDHRGMVKHAGA